MYTSLDGKIMGKYMSTPIGEKGDEFFYNVAFGKDPYYKHRGWLSGRVTTDDNFTNYKKPALEENPPEVPDGDYVLETNLPMYYFSVDPKGVLGWEKNFLVYKEVTAHVVEILTKKTPNAYKHFLRKLNIQYLICGDDKVDFKECVEKIKKIYGIETLMLGGGGVLNWSFIQQGLCDEVSIVMSSCADGSSTTPSLFCAKEGLATDKPINFKVLNVQNVDGDCLWIRYKVLNE